MIHSAPADGQAGPRWKAVLAVTDGLACGNLWAVYEAIAFFAA